MASYRAGIIGRTGRGDYGHSLDVAFVRVPGVEVVALADDDPVGRRTVGARTGARTLYADYREMLDKEQLDLVAVCPRWTDCHEEMVVAAAEAGARGILCEKPFAPTPAAADAMLEACDRAGTRVAVAHHRANPYEHHVKRLVDDGAIGDLQVIRSRGKCDWRSGGEDLFVLGSHMMESMRYIAGADAAWGFGHVTKKGRDVTVDDAVEGDEGLGLLAGDVVASYFAFENGVAGHFDSYPADLSERPEWHQGRWFGYEVYGTKGVISVRNPPRAETYVYPYGQWIAREEDGRWERIVIDEWESRRRADRQGAGAEAQQPRHGRRAAARHSRGPRGRRLRQRPGRPRGRRDGDGRPRVAPARTPRVVASRKQGEPVRDVASRGGRSAVSPRGEWRRQLRRVKVLFLPQQGGLSVGQESLVAAIGDRHDLSIFDHARPVAPQFEGVEVVVDMGGSVGTREMMDAATETRVWQVMGTGLEHVDLEYMKSRGFTITHCPGTLSAVAMAEAAMAFMLMISRRRNEAMEVFARAESNRPMGENLEGKVLGLVGFGASAQALAVRARAFDMRVFAVDVREIEPEVVERTGPEFLGTPEDLDYVIGESDFLSLHLHLNESTRHTIDARRIGLMKPSAAIINVARGALVDEDALYAALLEGRIGGAGLDVFAEEPPDPTLPVYKLPNVYVTPHVGGTTVNTSRGRAALMAENVDRVAMGLEPLHQVEPGVNL